MFFIFQIILLLFFPRGFFLFPCLSSSTLSMGRSNDTIDKDYVNIM